MADVDELSAHLGIAAACQELGVPRSSWYRSRRSQANDKTKTHPKPKRALTQDERSQVRDILNSERFVDNAPRTVFAALLDQGKYYCSYRTMYRILNEHQEVKERRNQLRHPSYSKPELLAAGPNQLWSWDITKLRGPAKWTYYYLYTILDVFSRYVVGWMIANSESATLAKTLIEETCTKQGVQRDQLTLHADRGSAMRSKAVALLLADLGVTKTHSRPYCSNDNPYSESQFKTLKYRPDYPDRFGSLQDARAWARAFFAWYNQENYHTGIALLTPEDVHCGRAEAMIAKRQQVLQAAYDAHPERFVKGPPRPPALPKEVWINKPSA